MPNFLLLFKKRQLTSKTAAALMQSKFLLQRTATSCYRNDYFLYFYIIFCAFFVLSVLSVNKTLFLVLSRLNINCPVKERNQFQVAVSKTSELEYSKLTSCAKLVVFVTVVHSSVLQKQKATFFVYTSTNGPTWLQLMSHQLMHIE